MRYLAIDLGDKRTGIAVGDDETGLASPVATLPVAAGPALLQAVRDEIARHAPDALVLGLPVSMDGSEGTRARLTRAFGVELDAATEQPLFYQDERLTSYAADKRLAGSGRTHKQKKKARDALAAVEILEDFLRGLTPGA